MDASMHIARAVEGDAMFNLLHLKETTVQQLSKVHHGVRVPLGDEKSMQITLLMLRANSLLRMLGKLLQHGIHQCNCGQVKILTFSQRSHVTYVVCDAKRVLAHSLTHRQPKLLC